MIIFLYILNVLIMIQLCTEKYRFVYYLVYHF